MPPFQIAEAGNPEHTGMRFGLRRVIVLVLVLVLDFLISAFGIRASFGFKPRLMGGGGEEFEDERKGGAPSEKNRLTTGRFIPTVR
jgi:hypothetical protein